MKTHQQYVAAILQNPKFMEVVSYRYAGGNSPSMKELAKAISDLDGFLEEKLTKVAENPSGTDESGIHLDLNNLD